jgi:hypothetical protein
MEYTKVQVYSIYITGFLPIMHTRAPVKLDISPAPEIPDPGTGIPNFFRIPDPVA